MGRRYKYNKKSRVRSTRRNANNTIVLELENETSLTLPSSTNYSSQSDDEVNKKWINQDNRMLVDLEQPMVLNVKKRSVVIECTNNNADKDLCISESIQPNNVELQPEVLNKNLVSKIKIESLRKNSAASRSSHQAIITKQPSNLVIKNNPTFILVSKTSIDDIEKKPINLVSSDINLRQISFKALGTKSSDCRPKNILVRHKSILLKSPSSSNAMGGVKTQQTTSQVPCTYALQKLPSFSSSNTVMCMQNSDNKVSSTGCLQIVDKVLKASSNLPQEPILQRLTSSSNSNPVICIKKSDNELLLCENSLVQDRQSINIVSESALQKHNEASEVYPVALNANNYTNSGAPKIFSNDSLSDEEMQILGI